MNDDEKKEPIEEHYDLLVIPTKAFDDQKPGTSGLRKKVKTFKQENYLENFIQSIFDCLDRTIGCTLVLGGDGRFYNDVAIRKIIRMAAANLVAKVIVGVNGIMSTPNVSQIITNMKAYGGIILTASHNPGGENEDFGVKYNCENGGPAPSTVTSKIFEISKKIETYKIAKQNIPERVDLSKVGSYTWAGMDIEVIDSVHEYVEMCKGLFSFDKIKAFVDRDDFSMVFDAMHGVAGPFAKAVFCKELGVPEENIMNSDPKPDFGGGHPDPNLKYAKDLVLRMGLGETVADDVKIPDFGAAADGDADRNMITGHKFFVTPSDSVAIIAANHSCIPYFSGSLKGLARSMPTSGALDFVAKKLKVPLHEVPTGWKYFGNLMDYGKLSICGEESFGTGSDHVREKDGLWAVLAWLSILASKNKDGQPLVTVEKIVNDHWKEFGRNYYTRYDYEAVDKGAAEKMMEHLRSKTKEFTDSKEKPKLDAFTIEKADEFEYKDIVDNTLAKQQGIRFIMDDKSRIIFRLSGTGSVGATIRLYIEKYEASSGNLGMATDEALAPLVKIALEISNLQEFTGRSEPTVIT